ncbi:pentapeptide repeat-containing protein [Calothrix parasitica NIES-267]|uniref:Pentapeptide repeat-containing protein n=1 Tax=Calothrix parasitica NIES-267 TaxID=1973488 RepID=A0A1Z4LNH7_9CYAN|nr:pentapeptide repeat-containing protein [Calothrix parasitica NIES-267]
MNNSNKSSIQKVTSNSNNKLYQALVVGINKYKSRDLHNLRVPAFNARYIDNRLQQQFQVERLEKATRKQLKEEIANLFKPEGQHPYTALLYFSGYVLPRDKGITEIYLATSDSNPSQEYELGVSLSWLKKILQESPVEQQIIILDCCHQEYKNLDLNTLFPGNKAGKDRFCIISFHKTNKLFISKNSCSELTGAILNELKIKQEEYIDQKILIQRLKYYEKHLRRCGDFTRICFGKSIYLLSASTVPEGINIFSKEPNNPVDINNPYKGLAYFDYEDAKYFYGREKLTDELLEKVRENNFLAIMGATGSGKSSVIRAGLVYQIRQGEQISGSEDWQVYTFQPGKYPLQHLANELQTDVEEFRTKGSEYLKSICEQSSSRVVLVIDQLEEVFTLAKDKEERLREREQFFECLMYALEKVKNNKLCLVLGIRADFFGKFAEQEYKGLARKIQQHLVAVTPMDKDELTQAIEKPAKQLGYTIEPKLVSKLIEDVKNEPGSLPLLQYALQELWEQSTDKCLTVAAYNQLGKSQGIKGILEKHANKVYDSLNKDEQEIAEYIFIQLTQLGDGTGHSRKKVSRSKLIRANSKDKFDKVINILLENNLIAINQETLEDGQKADFLNLSHEALIRHWSKFSDLLYIHRRNIKLKDEIEEAAKKWKGKRKEIDDPKDFLYTGEELREAEIFIEKCKHILPLNADTERFITESQKNRAEQEREEKIQQQNQDLRQKRERENQKLRLIILLTIIVALLFIVSLSSFLFFLEAQKNCRF